MPSFDGPRPIHLAVNHTVAGNPSRLDRTIDLRLDDEWTRSMQPNDRRAVSALTSPLMTRYHYKLAKPSVAEPFVPS